MIIWRKSSYSGGGGGTNECVELARLPHGVGVRDSKYPHGPILKLGRAGLAALLDGIKAEGS